MEVSKQYAEVRTQKNLSSLFWLLSSLFWLLSSVLYAEGNWNGKSCAFTFTSDDGYTCNLDWKVIFDRYDMHFTVFATSNCPLTVADLNFIQQAGHEIASHSMTHPFLIRNTAFTVQYVGTGDSAWLSIIGDTLWLTSTLSENYKIVLTDSFCYYLVDLVSYIDSLPAYTCTLDYYPDKNWATSSLYLIETSPIEIKSVAYQALTECGSDMSKLIYETRGSKQYFDSVITDPTYECKTFAYPGDGHDEREMIVLRDSCGYIAARNGNPGQIPWASEGSYVWDKVTLYDIPTPVRANTWGNNSLTEAEMRDTVRALIADWKSKNAWIVTCVHNTLDIDTLHLSWMLDELQKDGDVWVETFGTIAEYVRATHHTDDGWNWVPGPAVEESTSQLSADFSLHIYPNPCTHKTVIRVRGATSRGAASIGGCGSLTIYDLTGRLVRSWDLGLDKCSLSLVVWDGKDNSGRRVEGGVYFVVVQIGRDKLTNKLVIFN